MTLVTGTFFYHQYFSSPTLLMFNSINFSLPPKPSGLPPLCPPPLHRKSCHRPCHGTVTGFQMAWLWSTVIWQLLAPGLRMSCSGQRFFLLMRKLRLCDVMWENIYLRQGIMFSSALVCLFSRLTELVVLLLLLLLLLLFCALSPPRNFFCDLSA